MRTARKRGNKISDIVPDVQISSVYHVIRFPEEPSNITGAVIRARADTILIK